MEKTISNLKSGPPPRKQPEAAANLQQKPACTYTQMLSDAGVLLLEFAAAMYTGDRPYIARGKLREKCEVKCSRKISDEEFKEMIQKMDK